MPCAGISCRLAGHLQRKVWPGRRFLVHCPFCSASFACHTLSGVPWKVVPPQQICCSSSDLGLDCDCLLPKIVCAYSGYPELFSVYQIFISEIKLPWGRVSWASVFFWWIFLLSITDSDVITKALCLKTKQNIAVLFHEANGI